MLAGHSSSSRPDITIRLKAAGRAELIFVESKLPATQGDDQLQRYADHLVSEFRTRGFSKASLVFITRDYEAAQKPMVADSSFQPAFVQTRWFQFYRHLKNHLNGDGLAEQLRLFMEENRMSLGNQFRSIDLVALENFLGAKALMDETLDGEVADEAQKILGSIDRSEAKKLTQLREHERYIIMNSNWQILPCLIGYWLPSGNPDDRVMVGISLESNPNATARKEVVAAFRTWVAGEGNSWTLDGESEWSPMSKRKELQCFTGGENHVRAIKNYLLGLLEEVGRFRKSHPEAPWA